MISEETKRLIAEAAKKLAEETMPPCKPAKSAA